MRFQFKNKKLEALYTEERDAHKYPPGVVSAFFEVMAVIQGALDERDLYALKGLRYEKLAGGAARREQHSLRLNKQFRLIVERAQDDDGLYLLIVNIEDYH